MNAVISSPFLVKFVFFSCILILCAFLVDTLRYLFRRFPLVRIIIVTFFVINVVVFIIGLLLVLLGVLFNFGKVVM